MRGSLTITQPWCSVTVFSFAQSHNYTLPCEEMNIVGCIITNMNLTLAQALRVTSSPSIAFIGAGGKTTAMFQLARELPTPVIVTATSHLGAWQTKFADQHIIPQTPA